MPGRRRGTARVTASPSRTVIAPAMAANTATIRAGGAVAKGSDHDMLSVPSVGNDGRL